ncbi:MAG: zinc/iron-chelating domain-containing protein [Proteobacteria bacterium]|nr:MAG: zinc/iron-chelating domain-containing protein [Pseudomonadota bacterium]
MMNPVTRLEKDQSFCFDCSPQVECFNACCRDLNQALSPYDVLRLKQFLKMDSSAFLKAYTWQSTGPGSGLPVVCLRFGDTDDLSCPFVMPDGCRVYPARPASCRTYPLARGVSRNRETGVLTEHWALIRESHCLGFHNGRAKTIDAWIADQCIEDYNRMNDAFLELISHKNHTRPGVLTPSESALVFTALYDLDRFRSDLLTNRIPKSANMDPDQLESARKDDLELLNIAMQWVRTQLLPSSTNR